MRLLDLFCGAGGAAMGYYRAGFEVVGVDIEPQPNYPFKFVQADALNFPLDGFQAVHASPPCQASSALRYVWPDREHPELIPAVRQRLADWGGLYVIENVPGAPLASNLLLCGSMFGLGSNGRQLRRHRYFECSFEVRAPRRCAHTGRSVGVYGDGGGQNVKGRHYMGNAYERREAMGIGWMSRAELSQAIPPAYTEHIGRRLREVIEV